MPFEKVGFGHQVKAILQEPANPPPTHTISPSSCKLLDQCTPHFPTSSSNLSLSIAPSVSPRDIAHATSPSFHTTNNLQTERIP